MRIILHAGTPKTGTTSLQIAFDEHRSVLRARGLLYPDAIATRYAAANRHYNAKPKHQWLVDDLQAHDAGDFAKNIARALGQASANTETVVLSTEGLFTHWWDFSPAGRAALSELARTYNVEIWVWFRDPVEFFVSFYIQMLRNPRSKVACHGQDWSPEEMLEDFWFAKHLDYMDFVDQARSVLGAGDAVRVFRYRRTTTADFLSAVGLVDFALPELQENRSFGGFGVEAVRLLNRYDLPADRKDLSVELIAQIDGQMGPTTPAFELAPLTRASVIARAKPSLGRLRDEFGMDLHGPDGRRNSQ